MQAVMTHEAGHVMGLDHVVARTATMYPFIYPGEIRQRALAQDEISAAQWIYPSAGAPADTTISGTVLQGGAGMRRNLSPGRTPSSARLSGFKKEERRPPGDMRALFEGLEQAFDFFGGVPREILLDQMRAVVVADHRFEGGASCAG